MKNYVDIGKGLYLEHAKALPYHARDLSMSHMHPCYELVMTLDDVPYSTVLNGKIMDGVGPMAMIVSPYCMHHTYWLDPSAKDKWFSVFYVGQNFLDSFSDDMVPFKSLMENNQAIIFDLNGYEAELREIMKPIIDIHKRNKLIEGRYFKDTNVKQGLLFGVIVNMLYEMSKNNALKTVTSTKSYIYDVIVYIVKNLDKNLTTTDIGTEFFVSRDKLNRDFKQYTNMTVRDFVTQARMNLAKSWLSETDYTVSEISRMCGFENDIYFYTFFKKYTGMTPRQYAEKIKR